MLVDLNPGPAGCSIAANTRRSSGSGLPGPDGRSIAYSWSGMLHTTIIKLVRVDRRRDHTDHWLVLQDVNPAFHLHGRILDFLGRREFDPVYDKLHFDLSFPRGVRGSDGMLAAAAVDASFAVSAGLGTNANGDGRSLRNVTRYGRTRAESSSQSAACRKPDRTPPAQEIQIFPVRIENRIHILQHRPSDRRDCTVVQPNQLDDRRVRRTRPTVGDRSPIGAVEPEDRRVFAAIEHPAGPAFQIDQHQLVAHVRQGDKVTDRTDRQPDNAADVDSFEHFRLGRARVEHHDRFFSFGIADGDEPLAIGQPTGQSIPADVGFAMLLDRAFEIAHRHDLAVRGESEQMSLRVQRDRLHLPGRFDEAPVALWRGP